ncbi:MAG: hypothetical protein WCC17_20820 [Candidatus Nitrosopolaris sp.]
MTSSGLKWYSELREELRKYGISVDDIQKLAKLVNHLKQYDYNVEKVINEFSDLEGLRLHRKYLQETTPSWENRNKDLKRRCSTLEALIATHNQVLSKYHDLEIMGFGLNQLQFLCTTVNAIARENNIPLSEAATKFLSDVERQYNNKLGFESTVEGLRNEVNKLNQEQVMLRTGLLSLPLVGPKLVKLTQSGVTEQDIINMAAVFEKYIAYLLDTLLVLWKYREDMIFPPSAIQLNTHTICICASSSSSEPMCVSEFVTNVCKYNS